MKKPLRQQIDDLAAMDVAALQTRHLEFFGKEITCAHRQFLIRKLAWHLQAKAEGGLPESAIELARSIARDTPPRNRVLTNADWRQAGMPMDNSSTTAIEPAHDARTPLPGGLIIKRYRCNTYVVTVRDNGFEYGGCLFPSLSAVAFEITRTKWNGYLFLGRAQRKSAGSGRIDSDRTGGRGRDLVGVNGDCEHWRGYQIPRRN